MEIVIDEILIERVVDFIISKFLMIIKSLTHKYTTQEWSKGAALRYKP
jgi:hypothetical protein